MPTAISIIHDEHRSFSAVLEGLLFLTGEIRAARLAPDFALLGAMLRYVEAFPERLHHPKEDAVLFPAVRRRDPAVAGVLDELEAEHAAGQARIAELLAALEDYQRSGPPGFDRFAAAAEDYARFHWEHMRKEEELVLPRAERVLQDDDWREIDAAFLSNADPLSGTGAKRELRELFREIAHLAPPPIGVGKPSGG